MSGQQLVASRLSDVQLKILCGVLISFFGFFVTAAIADASKGDFLGYTIGSRLRIDDPSLIQRNRDVSFARLYRSYVSLPFEMWKPAHIYVKPINREFDQVLLLISPESNTVIEIRGIIRTTSQNKYEAIEEARDLQARFGRILSSKYPDWKFEVDSCRKWDESWGSSCYVTGEEYAFYLHVNNSRMVYDPEQPNNLLGKGRDHWQLEITLVLNDDSLYDLDHKERHAFVKRQQVEAINETDKTGL